MPLYHRKGEKSTPPDSEAKKAWIKANTQFVSIKLNNKTDADILSALEKQPSKQGYIKQAIRNQIKADLQSTSEKEG